MMLCHVGVDGADGHWRFLGLFEGEPECGVDFCDSCGDCLVCCGETACFYNADGQHLWVKTIAEEEVSAFVASKALVVAEDMRKFLGGIE